MGKRWQRSAVEGSRNLNRYDFYPGDYLRDTLTLTIAQDGVYRRLLDHYYSSEVPLADEQEAFAAARCRTREEEEITQWVLRRFFEFTPDGFRHTKADREIAKARPKIEAARRNGALGGRPKKQDDKPSRFSVGLPEETQTVTQVETQTVTQEEPTNNPGRKLPSPSVCSSSSAREASAPTTDGPCPPDLELTADEFGQLAMGVGMTRDFVDRATPQLRAQFASQDPRTPGKWRRTLVKSLTIAWNDRTQRKKYLETSDEKQLPSKNLEPVLSP